MRLEMSHKRLKHGFRESRDVGGSRFERVREKFSEHVTDTCD
jgi:hypothetical protein